MLQLTISLEKFIIMVFLGSLYGIASTFWLPLWGTAIVVGVLVVMIVMATMSLEKEG